MTQVYRGNSPLDRCPVCTRLMAVDPQLIVREDGYQATWQQYCLEGCSIAYIYAPPVLAAYWLTQKQKKGAS